MLVNLHFIYLSRNQRAPKRGSRYGFSLVEVLLALALISIAVIALIVERTRAFKQTTDTHSYRVATMLAYEKMEELRAGIETETEGTFESHPDHTWQAVQETEIVNIDETTQLEMSKWILTLQYPSSQGQQEIVFEALSAVE